MRDITAAVQTELDADNLRPALFVKAEFDSNDVLLWTGRGDKVFNGETYQGAGYLLGITPVQETQALQANGLQFTLTGITGSLVSLALSEDYQWRPITLWFAVLDSSKEIISNPYKLFSGKMDVMEINDDGQEATIIVTAENNLIALKENAERRYTPEDQKRYYPNDKGLDFVPLIQDIELTWGMT